MVSVCVYWRYKKYLQNDAKSTNLSGNPTDSVNLNMMHTRKAATRTDDTVLGQEAVRIQVLGEPYKKVSVKNPVHGSEVSALLDQLEELGIDISKHCRKQRIRQYDALPSIEYWTPLTETIKLNLWLELLRQINFRLNKCKH